jgi:hypothetical protein
MQPRITEVPMLKRHYEVPHAGRRPQAAERAGTRQVAAASVLAAAVLSMLAFVALYRGPLPAESFTALAVQLADKADMARVA